ncbi:MAG TPA: XRE family transcriptional regulator [Geobacteraceae bacterium]|nr:XRE family transcriptional regulator [Geobacteraceae bacterium]
MSDYNIGAKIKKLRLAKKMTLQAVAKETGFSPALISQIENNNVSPPIATLSKIAKFFDVKIGIFFTEDEQEYRYEVVRKGERKLIPRVISRSGTSQGYSYESLSFRKQNKKMEPFFLTVTEKAAEENTYSHDGEEFIFIMDGTAELILDDERITLGEGDCVYFDSSLKHRLLSMDGSEVRALAVVTR